MFEHQKHGRDREAKGQGGGGRRTRLLEHGDLKIIILDLVAVKPRHGYEIIRAVEEMAGGDYSPSPGVVYPTLTLLVELGHATIVDDSGARKQYSITPEGQLYLDGQSEALHSMRERISQVCQSADARGTPEIARAIQNFKTALHMRLARTPLSIEEIRAIADVLDNAARSVERC
ncbi:MAG: PadR family transcriptional regulator [Pseudomonadota bacterium]